MLYLYNIFHIFLHYLFIVCLFELFVYNQLNNNNILLLFYCKRTENKYILLKAQCIYNQLWFYLFIYLFIYILICIFVCLFIYLFIYLIFITIIIIIIFKLSWQ